MLRVLEEYLQLQTVAGHLDARVIVLMRDGGCCFLSPPCPPRVKCELWSERFSLSWRLTSIARLRDCDSAIVSENTTTIHHYCRTHINMAESSHTPASEPEKDVQPKTDEQAAGSGEVCRAVIGVGGELCGRRFAIIVNYSMIFVELVCSCKHLIPCESNSSSFDHADRRK